MQLSETAQFVSRIISQPKQQGFGLWQLLGCFCMITISGLSSLAGLGGGGPNVVILILFFNFLPKQATIMVFACILGSSCGNMLNQTRRQLDGEPVVHFGFAFVTIPVMFMGSIIGVFMNKVLPSLATVSIIFLMALTSLPKIFNRFRLQYQKQNEMMLLQGERKSGIIVEKTINPFQNEFNRKVALQTTLLILSYVALSLCKGSDQFSSILGIQSCSFIYWVLQLAIFVIAFHFFKSNMHLFNIQTATTTNRHQELLQREDLLQLNMIMLIRNGVSAGVFAGLGVGGGIFLVPLFRSLKLSPIQASSTCALTVGVTALLNVIQGLFLGVLGLRQFLFLFGVTFVGGYMISRLVSVWLRRINRTSLVELLFFLLLSFSVIYLPYSLWLKVQRSGGDMTIILAYGSFC